MSDADFSMKTMNVDKDERYRILYEENITLNDDLQRHEALIESLKQEHSETKKQLCVWFASPLSVPTIRG